MRIARVAVAACAGALAFPGSALAIRCAPPGNSQVDQYYETIPGSSCNQASPGSIGAGSGSNLRALPPGTSRQLAAQGEVGRVVAQLVAQTVPRTAGVARATRGSRGGAAGLNSRSGAGFGRGVHPAGASASGRGPVSGLLHPIVAGSASGGLGILLPILLAVALSIAAAAVLRQRLRS